MTNEGIYTPPNSDLNNEHDSNVAELKLAGFWPRAGASIIDTILIMLVTSPLLTLIYGIDYWTAESQVQGIWDVVISYLVPGCIVILFWLLKSATPGKMLFGLKIVDANTLKNVGTGQAIGRYLAYYVSALLLCIGFIWVAFDKRKQGWHDKIAKTLVVKM